MASLPLETWNIILSLLKSNHDKFHLLISFKDMLKCNILFDDLVDINKIIHSQWFDNFRSISMIYGDRCAKYINFPRESKCVQIIYKGTIDGASWLDRHCYMINNKISISDLHFREGIERLIFNCHFDKKYISPVDELAKIIWSFKDMNLPISLKYITFTAIVNNSYKFENVDFVKYDNSFQCSTIDNEFNTITIDEFPIDAKNITVHTHWNSNQGDISNTYVAYHR